MESRYGLQPGTDDGVGHHVSYGSAKHAHPASGRASLHEIATAYGELEISEQLALRNQRNVAQHLRQSLGEA